MNDGEPTSLVSLDRITRRLDELLDIGRTEDGGVTRLAYSDAETRAFEYVQSELPTTYDVQIDSIGNFFASVSHEADQTTLIGSHLDSVFNGGRLDGALGVVVAMEALDVLSEIDASPRHPPTLAVFRGEESARFGHHTIGSRGALGLLTVDDFSRTDQNDVPLWLAMQRAGFRPSDLSEPTICVERIQQFFETHIEQGRVLDEADDVLGIVTSIRAPVRYEVTVTGTYDHSGATPMNLRSDALAAAGEMVTAVENAATDVEGVVATVGDITAHEGAINTVCGKVTFPLDIRSDTINPRDAVEADILERFADIADCRGLSVSTDELDRSKPVSLSSQTVDKLDSTVYALDIPYQRLPSGGGHDAMNFQKVGIPTGMLFVPSVDGISHSPYEKTYPEAIEASAAAMVRVLS
ncbi:Zn-dependent hydrolase [Halegenticoccus tardaugens]|uniref:Zn-dependent hydrolase n=1 Tax=Halegenticoccus tardaugens TaxID=2071624 RepID=UPI00100A9FBB|nr:Zn-dependent hydrolase [Halegenticoccus tardaugens]